MGKVYLVGAGPGDPELLTLRGKRALERADCILYDNLVSHALLALAPPDAERIYVGKKKAEHAASQEEICQMLVDEGDRDAAFAHTGRDALDAAVAHIAGREDSGHARLQQVRVALERPRLRHQVDDVAARADESALVADDLLGQPASVGVGADENEEGVHIDLVE